MQRPAEFAPLWFLLASMLAMSGALLLGARLAAVPLWFLFANWLLVVAAFLLRRRLALLGPSLLFTSWLAVVAAFALGVHLARLPALPEPQATALHLVHQEILRSHVEVQDPNALLDRALGAMAHLDDYSEYVPPGRLAQFLEDTTGAYEGIGVATYREPDSARVFVRFPFAGGPGERAGLLPGDEILAVDGETLKAMPAAQLGQLVEQRIRGPAGTKVRLAIARAGGERQIEVERGPVQKASVRWAQMLDREAGLGYVHVSDFHPGLLEQLAAAMARLQSAPSGLRGLVLDLRFDGGGSLDECIEVARLFLASGNITSVRRRGSEVLQSLDAEPSRCRFPDLPLCVLVNRDSASASEVLTGALQDHDRAAVVGTRTYGKGMVNTVFSWRNLAFRLKLTTGHYYTPDGRNLEKHDGEGGITPDVAVQLDEQLQQVVKAALRDHEVPERHLEAVQAFHAARNLRLPGILPPDQDPQLAAALQALRARVAGPTGNGK